VDEGSTQIAEGFMGALKHFHMKKGTDVEAGSSSAPLSSRKASEQKEPKGKK
jgi:hypothetical protein